jgi:hypothetical protein
MEALEAHLLYGYVFSTPDAFVMGRPVRRDGDVGDVWRTWPLEECDAWFVWVGVGEVAQLLDFIPFPLPWIGWNRVGRGWTEDHWIPIKMLSRAKKFESALAKIKNIAY